MIVMEVAMHRIITPLLVIFNVCLLAACNPIATEPSALESQENDDGLTPSVVAPTIAPERRDQLTTSVSETIDAYPPPPLPTVEPPPDVFPTPIVLTAIPSPTLEPVPTLPPTPVVTPIPTLSTGFDVPEPEPFWIYGWRDNTVWRMHSERQEEEVLLDTMEILGLPLADNAELPHEEFSIEPVVTVAPDGTRLAIVTADVAQNTPGKGEVTFLISVIDLNSGQIIPIGPGTLPRLSPDGNRVAFVRDGSLWVAQVDTGEVAPVVTVEGSRARSIATLVWAPDSEQIAFMYREGSHNWLPTIWLVNATDSSDPRQLVNHPGSVYQFRFAADGQKLYFLGSGTTPNVHEWNIWSVALDTMETSQLTHDMHVDSFFVSPDGAWLFFGGYHLHEPTALTATRDLWLWEVSDASLHRLTLSADVGAIGWNSNSSQVIAADWASSSELIIHSLGDLGVSRLMIVPDSRFAVLTTP